jgi:copper chaperone
MALSSDEVASYKVGGMTCGGCARSVTNAIVKAAPAAKVTVDLSGGTVTVDGGIPTDAVRHAIETAGFDFGGPVS